MNDTCYFTLDMKKLDLCSLLIYTPSSGAHRPRRNRCVFSCKMRLAFISTVNLRDMYVPVPPTAEKSLCFLM